MCDINDNAPQFPLGGYSVNISEGAKANSDVIAAVALDPDAGSNSQLIYELISGNTGGKFYIMQKTSNSSPIILTNKGHFIFFVLIVELFIYF